MMAQSLALKGNDTRVRTLRALCLTEYIFVPDNSALESKYSCFNTGRSERMSDIVKLHYVEAGQGTPVVLLHGFPLSCAIWREQIRDLSQSYRVITPDLRGHGASPVPTGIYEMSHLAGDVLALLDVLHIRQAFIIGHSMGGYVTLAAWRLAPLRFLGMGLVASHAAADSEEGRHGRYRMAEKLGSEGSQVAVDAMLPKIFAAGQSLDSPLVEQVRQLIVNTSCNGMIGAQKGMAARPDSTDLLPTINVPSLVLAGGRDQIIPIERARATATAMPRSTLAIIDEAGHMPMLECPAATTAAIRNFLGQTTQ
jgi:pimeloyl-ACP methyl ester carboxylesterase